MTTTNSTETIERLRNYKNEDLDALIEHTIHEIEQLAKYASKKCVAVCVADALNGNVKCNYEPLKETNQLTDGEK